MGYQNGARGEVGTCAPQVNSHSRKLAPNGRFYLSEDKSKTVIEDLSPPRALNRMPSRHDTLPIRPEALLPRSQHVCTKADGFRSRAVMQEVTNPFLSPRSPRRNTAREAMPTIAAIASMDSKRPLVYEYPVTSASGDWEVCEPLTQSLGRRTGRAATAALHGQGDLDDVVRSPRGERRGIMSPRGPPSGPREDDAATIGAVREQKLWERMFLETDAGERRAFDAAKRLVLAGTGNNRSGYASRVALTPYESIVLLRAVREMDLKPVKAAESFGLFLESMHAENELVRPTVEAVREVLNRRSLLLPGSTDQNGAQVLYINVGACPRSLDDDPAFFKALVYMYDLAFEDVVSQREGITVVADMAGCRDLTKRMLGDEGPALFDYALVQPPIPGKVRRVVLVHMFEDPRLQPAFSSSVNKAFARLTNARSDALHMDTFRLKASHKTLKTTKLTMADSDKRLWNFVPKHRLLMDFGGQVSYNHGRWIKQRYEIEGSLVA